MPIATIMSRRFLSHVPVVIAASRLQELTRLDSRSDVNEANVSSNYCTPKLYTLYGPVYSEASRTELIKLLLLWVEVS